MRGVHSAPSMTHRNRRLGRQPLPPRGPAARRLGRQRAGSAELRGDEVVLDAGCGSGRVTAQLLERLPRGRVIAADNSPAMLAEARATLAPFGGAGRVRRGRPARDRPRTRRQPPVDVIFSTAVFHWIADHPRLFAALHRVVRAGRAAGGAVRRRRATWPVHARRRRRRGAPGPYAATSRASRCGASTTRPKRPRHSCSRPPGSRARAWLEPSPQTLCQRRAQPGRLRPRAWC